MTTEDAIKKILAESHEDYMAASYAGMEGDKVTAISGSIDALLIRMAVNWLRDNAADLITEGQIVRRMERGADEAKSDVKYSWENGREWKPKERLAEALDYAIELLRRKPEQKDQDNGRSSD